MKHFLIGCIIGMLPLLWSCGNEGDGQGTPASPEEVLRAYQTHIDNNDFEKAKALSTRDERARLDAFAKRILSHRYQDATIMNTVFLDIDCELDGDVAHCLCLVEDDYERYETEYMLVKRKQRWLVDAPEEPYQIKQEDIERMMEYIQ